MRRPSATMEWQIVQEEQTWRQLVQATPSTPQPRRLPGWLGEALLSLLLLCGVALAYGYIKQTAWQQTQTELAAVIQPDRTAALPIHVLTLEGNQAIVNDPTSGQTRFYQRTVAGWQPVMPSAEDWGAWQQQETLSFRWHYQAQDAPIVATVAPRLEALYATLRHNFALTTASVTRKMGIEVSLTHPWDKQALLWDKEGRLHVPSPTRYQMSLDVSDTEVLLQSLALPLLNGVMTEATERYQLASTWQPLLDGLHLWQLWDLDLPLADWHEEVVTWVYLDLPTSRPDQGVVLPAHYPAICAAHKLWLPSPTAIDIPLLCEKLTWEDFLLSPWGWYEPLTHLNQLNVPLRPGEYLEEPDSLRAVRHPGHTVALATLIEYAVAVYGRERLPVLVAGLGQYESWETLLPAIYGASASEFEAGWQEYLAAHYDVVTAFRR